MIAFTAFGLSPSSARGQSREAIVGSCPADAIAVDAGSPIQDAVDAAPAGSKFCIQAGIHRMQSVVPKAGQVFIGQSGAILDGARVLSGFTYDGGYWVVSDPDQPSSPYGYCKSDHPECADAAGVFVNGHGLTQVAAKSELEPGEFFFDAAHHLIVIADDPAGKLIEAASTEFAFSGPANDVIIQNLIVEKYRNPAQMGAVNGASARGWHVENSEFRLDSGAGVSVGSDGEIRNCNIHHNGQLGAGGHGTNIVLAGNKVWANNTAMFNPDWEAGGIKIALGKNITFDNNYVHDNDGPGIWCDIDCNNVVYDHNTVEDNSDAGIFFEISTNATIHDNVLRGNGKAQSSWYWGADIQIAASQDVSVCDNHITVRPGGRAIMLIDQSRLKDDGGYYQTRDDLVCRNDVRFLGTGSLGGASDAFPWTHNYSIIENGNNRFVDNRYRYKPSDAPVFAWGHERLDFEEFQRRGQDVGSTLTTDQAAAE
jgi:parallel beta-helix repeat protein